MNLSSIILCIILETILLFFYGCSTKGPTQVAGGSKVGNASLIQGRVFSPGGQPAADAQAILRPRQFIKDTSFASLSKDAANAMETRTDANGYFSFASVDIGEYNIEVNNQNHLAIVLTCSLALQNTQIDFPDTTLQPTGSLTGQISLYGITDTSAPAYVAIEGLDRIVKVDSNGGFNFPDLPVGQFQVKTIISVQGNNATGSMSFTIKPSEADTLDTLYVLPKVTRSGMRITAILHDSLLSAATIHDSVDFVFVRKPDTLKWSMATTPLTLTAQLMTTNGFGRRPAQYN